MKKLIAGFIVFALLILQHETSVYANTNVSPMVELVFGAGTKIYGMTALDSLGKKTGTLEEFANAAPISGNNSYVLFPGNYFNAYEDTREVYGGILSNGVILHDSWLNCGFDKDNRFYLFESISAVNDGQNSKVTIIDGSREVDIITGFNCYPWLVKDGVKQTITPTAAMDTNFLNARAQRAFMGQRNDGVFIYGMVSGVTIAQLQDIVMELRLVNAVNTDGGASAGLYKDGAYLARSGRELASVVVIETAGGSVPAPQPISGLPSGDSIIKVIFNGSEIDFDVPPIIQEGRTLVPLRAIFEALGAEVSWDGQTQVITAIREDVTVTMQIGNTAYTRNHLQLLLDVPPQIINDRTLVPVRAVAESFGAEVNWDANTRTITIDQ